ncbi:hypothetical protein [Pedobacter terrae]
MTSNKWMRAAYGKSLRKFFVEKTDLIRYTIVISTKYFIVV